MSFIALGLCAVLRRRSVLFLPVIVIAVVVIVIAVVVVMIAVVVAEIAGDAAERTRRANGGIVLLEGCWRICEENSS